MVGLHYRGQKKMREVENVCLRCISLQDVRGIVDAPVRAVEFSAGVGRCQLGEIQYRLDF